MRGMETTYTPLPVELRPLLSARGDEPLYLRDGETQRVFVLIEETSFHGMSDDDLRRALQPALDEEARGDYAPLDFDAIRREGARILAERKRPSPS
jgi:hypothetical protein